jgi:hypothetical protein
MAKDKTKGRRTIELIVLVVIIICVGLILVELYNNVTAEIATNNGVSMLPAPFKPPPHWVGLV